MIDIERILDFIFPPECINCGKIGQWICSNCYDQYFVNSNIECVVCRNKSNDFATHTKCLHNSNINKCIICWKYNKLAKKVMRSFKYGYHYAVANFLSGKVIAQFEKYFSEGTLLVPVPSHPDKFRERGFNQSQILAKRYSRLTELEVIEPLIRKVDSKQHAGMTRKDRISDENPFQLRPEFVEKLKNRKLMIVDDVCTTGTTLFQCASQLKLTDPKSVSAIALFRGEKIKQGD